MPTENDPRRLGGDIAGPGGPHDRGQTVIDTRNAVLLETTTVVKADNPSDGRAFMAMQLEGRVNQTSDRASVLYLFDEDGAAAIVTELFGLAQRGGFGSEFVEQVTRRLADLPGGVVSEGDPNAS